MLPGLVAFAVAVVSVALATHGRGGGRKDTPLAHAGTSHPSAVARSPAPAAASPRRAPPRTSAQGRRLPWPSHAAPWRAAALATARTFVTWFDRWLVGESSARQAPDVTGVYARKLLTAANNVPPAARGHVAVIVSLIPAAMPPDATHPREAWIYTATRSQGAVVRFTVEEQLIAGRWLVYDLYQGP